MLFNVECMEHGESHVKHIVDMAICPHAIKYILELVVQGDMPMETCEKCIIEWICNDVLVSCVDESKMYMQCPKPATFWVELYESLINDTLACETDEKYIIPINFTQHVANIKQIIVQYGGNPLDHHKITQFIIEDVKWWMEHTDFSDNVMLVDSMVNFGLIE
jgi:hypothetical protein